MLNEYQYARYTRHFLLPEIGVKGQEKISAAKVLVVGAGGLGSPIILYLAASGIGTLGIVEFDTVDESNLQRQILYGFSDIGLSKAMIASKRARAINPNINVITYNKKLNSGNVLKIFNDYDYIIDATDNLATRFLINDACILLGKTYVFGSIYNFEGQISVFGAKNGPCYRCLYPKPPKSEVIPNSLDLGVFGILPAVVGSIQATEVIKLICNVGTPIIGRLLLYDALDMKLKEVELHKNEHCPICSANATIKKLDSYNITNNEPHSDEIKQASAFEIKTALVNKEEILILDVREECELSDHIKGSVNIPINALEDRLGEIKQYKNTKIVVASQTGNRSNIAAKILYAKGYKQVINLDGGLTKWFMNNSQLKNGTR